MSSYELGLAFSLFLLALGLVAWGALGIARRRQVRRQPPPAVAPTAAILAKLYQLTQGIDAGIVALPPEVAATLTGQVEGSDRWRARLLGPDVEVFHVTGLVEATIVPRPQLRRALDAFVSAGRRGPKGAYVAPLAVLFAAHFALLLVGCLGGAQTKPGKQQIAASLDERGDEMATFRTWSLKRQTAIVDRCEAEIRAPRAARVVTPADCERRVGYFLETRDEALKLFRGQAKTLRLFLALVDDGGAQ